MVSLYAQDSDLEVYCPTCFDSDAWDPMEYGRPYDFKKSFFEQWLHLQQSIPHRAIIERRVNAAVFIHELRQ